MIPGLGISSGEGNGNPLQYSCLENPKDRGACQATVQGVAKSWTQLNSNAFSFFQGTRSHMLQFKIPHAATKTHRSQINKYYKKIINALKEQRPRNTSRLKEAERYELNAIWGPEFPCVIKDTAGTNGKIHVKSVIRQECCFGVHSLILVIILEDIIL